MYVKLFASLYQGTLRGHPDEILVFTNLLAHADRYGVVDKHWRAICDETGLSKERVEAALINLESPDPESRSPAMNGCRIIRLDEHRAWGWTVVNYEKYRAIRNEEDRREQNRLAQERWRNKQNKQSKPRSAHAEAEAEADKNPPNPPKGGRSRFALPEWIPEEVWADFKEHRKKLRKPMTARAEQMAVRELERLGGDPVAIIHQSIAKGWAGLFPIKQELPNGRRKTRAAEAWDDYEAFLRSEGSADGDQAVLAGGAGGPGGPSGGVGDGNGRTLEAADRARDSWPVVDGRRIPPDSGKIS